MDRTRSRARSNSPNSLYRPHSRPHSYNGRYSQFDQQQQQQRKSAHDVKAAAFLVNKWLMDCVQELGDPPVLVLIYVPPILVLALCPCPCAYPHISPLSLIFPPYYLILTPRSSHGGTRNGLLDYRPAHRGRPCTAEFFPRIGPHSFCKGNQRVGDVAQRTGVLYPPTEKNRSVQFQQLLHPFLTIYHSL